MKRPLFLRSCYIFEQPSSKNKIQKVDGVVRSMYDERVSNKSFKSRSTLPSDTYIKTSAHTYILYNSYTSELQMRIHALVIIVFTALPNIHVSRFAHLPLREHIGCERLLGQVARHMFLVKSHTPMVQSSKKQTKSY